MASRPGYGPPNPSGNPPNPYGQRPGGYPPEQGLYRGTASANSSQVPLATYDQSPSYDAYCSCPAYLAVPTPAHPNLFFFHSPRSRFRLRFPLQSAVFRLCRLSHERCQHEPAWSLFRHTWILCALSRLVFRTPDTHLHGGNRGYIP